MHGANSPSKLMMNDLGIMSIWAPNMGTSNKVRLSTSQWSDRSLDSTRPYKMQIDLLWKKMKNLPGQFGKPSEAVVSSTTWDDPWSWWSAGFIPRNSFLSRSGSFQSMYPRSFILIAFSDIYWLVVSIPLKNMSQIGSSSQLLGKIKFVPNQDTLWLWLTVRRG